MSLQWTPIRGRGSAVVKARQDVETLEHQTRANVLLAFKLSMVSGQNGVTEVVRPNLRTTYRKMADFGVQVNCDEELEHMAHMEQHSSPPTPPPPPCVETNIAVAEINTAHHESHDSNTYHRPLSLQSSSSSNSSGGGGERRRLQSEEDVDAICVQQTETTQLQPDTTELDGLGPPLQQEDKEESSCGLDCVTFTMQCCECTIL